MATGLYTQLESRGYALLSTSATAVGLTATYPANSTTGRQGIPNFAYISVDGSSARWRDDGTAPTATTGMPLPINTLLAYDGELGKFQIISSGAATATVNVTYYNAY